MVKNGLLNSSRAKFLFVFFPLSSLQVVLPNGKIILLSGTSCAGKTRTAKALLPLLNGTTEIVDGDQMAYEIIGQRFIEKYGRIAAEAELCSYRRNLYSQGMSDIFWNDVRQQEYEKARTLYLEGKNVIVDAVIDNEDKFKLYSKVFQDIPVFKVLVYCFPEKLLQHAFSRNQLEDKKEQVDLVFPLLGFFKMYKKRISDKEVQIDLLKKDAMEKVFKQLEVIVRQKTKDKTKLEKFLKIATSQTTTAFSELGLDKHEEVAITCKFSHDMMVNTGSFTPDECAKQIMVASDNFYKKYYSQISQK